MPARPAPTLSSGLLILGSLVLSPLTHAQTLAIEFIDTAASGQAMNGAGQVLGTRQVWPCGNPANCAPVFETSVWRAGQRLVLGAPVGRIADPHALGADGSVVGTVTDFNVNFAASRWVFDGTSYQRQDLGALPGTTQSVATGIDDSGRVVGWSITPFISQKAFVWTSTGGLVDLATLGGPSDPPRGISPGGRVITNTLHYTLDQPASTTALPAPPPGFRGPNGWEFRINDQGDLGGFLGDTTGSAPRYLFRWRAGLGQWQQLSPLSNSTSTSNWGVGRIDAAGGISATVRGAGLFAAGPDGLADSLSARLSVAYPDSSVLRAADHVGDSFLAQVGIGRAARLVRLVPAAACTSGCAKVQTLTMVGRFINDPNAPGSCTPKAKNKVSATLSVVDENGAALPNVRVQARYLDDYDLSTAVSGRTDAAGQVVFKHAGPACRGAITLLVESVKASGRRFDRTQGTLSGYVIPLPAQ
ncbi:hypothetical protein KAK07_18085 [Ideonella sp. 4Y16]|uniref:hypothetical protein n=1 Tax=Ideonella alba TaxID=2824118 RepID=UPI001B385A9F|nr:hypothetical protein [Ideonella alba]MBQ0945253.1 hypothetical protein [Ideonella alba]